MPRSFHEKTRKPAQRRESSRPLTPEGPTETSLLRRGVSNAGLSRLIAGSARTLLQRDDDDDLALISQRARARGMSIEDVAEERETEKLGPLARPGELATAEAQALHPAGPTGSAMAGLAEIIANKAALGPTGMTSAPLRAGAAATAEAQALHPPGPTGSQMAGLSETIANKAALKAEGMTSAPLRAGAVATAEAQALHPPAQGAQQTAALGAAQTLKQQLGRPVAKTVRKLEGRWRRTAQETVKGDEADRRRRVQEHEQAQAKPGTDEDARVRERAKYEVDLQVADVRRSGNDLVAKIDASHKEILDAADASIRGRAVAASNATAADYQVVGAALPATAKQFSDHAATVLRNRGRTATDRLRALSNASLAEALNYNAPALVAAYGQVTPLEAAQNWLDIGPSLDALEAAFEPFKTTLPTIMGVITREAYVTTHHATAGTADATGQLAVVQGLIATRHATGPAGLKQLANLMDGAMRQAEKPVSLALFNAAWNSGANFRNNVMTVLSALHTNGLIRPGDFKPSYPTSSDGDGFSVECTVQGLPDIVIHAHCRPDCTPKDGMAAHWKWKEGKFDPTKSWPIPDGIRAAFISRRRALIKPPPKVLRK